MLERIRIAVLMLLGILCITTYVVIFSGSETRDEGKRSLASEEELDIIDY